MRYYYTCSCGNPTLEPHTHRHEYEEAARMTEYKKLGEFAIPFAFAVSKMKKAFDAREGVALTADEVKAVVESLQMLSQGTKT